MGVKSVAHDEMGPQAGPVALAGADGEIRLRAAKIDDLL